jgi:hypothetical protein
MRYREVMALMISKAILEDFPGAGPYALLRRPQARLEFRSRLESLARSLRQEADVTVLRGLLALEEGEVDEAEAAFRAALALWGDETLAATGGGLEFNGRVIAQSALEWVE